MPALGNWKACRTCRIYCPAKGTQIQIETVTDYGCSYKWPQGYIDIDIDTDQWAEFGAFRVNGSEEPQPNAINQTQGANVNYMQEASPF